MRKLWQKGALGTLEAVFARVESWSGRIKRRLAALRLLRQAGHRAVFAQEGGIQIRLPRHGWLSGVLGVDPQLPVSADFLKSAGSEPLLRHVVFRLLAEGQVGPGKIIVDIGCWCGDNALAWAGNLGPGARVIGIDPSGFNLAYASSVADENGIDNVTWVQAVCADRAGVPLAHKGPLEHASFHEAPAGNGVGVTSTTLDAVVGDAGVAHVGLLHVDVEGFEERVLRGAAGIIRQSRPVIVFEQHLCTDDTEAIAKYLTAEGYRVFMVNELIQDCRLDCRNFVAFPAGSSIPTEWTEPMSPDPEVRFVPAVPGAFLLPYETGRNDA